MRKEEAIEMIDRHKNVLIDPAEMLHWTWLRCTLNSLPDEEWQKAQMAALPTLSS